MLGRRRSHTPHPPAHAPSTSPSRGEALKPGREKISGKGGATALPRKPRCERACFCEIAFAEVDWGDAMSLTVPKVLAAAALLLSVSNASVSLASSSPTPLYEFPP